jgi:thioredoxin reductase
MHDVIIIGGGPAGLNAALILGRCRRSVLVIDAEEPRNAVSRGINGFITRDGADPMEFRAKAREELTRYDTVEIIQGRARHAERDGETGGGFTINLEDGTRHTSRKLIFATGLIDELPKHPGFRELYGRAVFHCPYCDGWNERDKPLLVYGQGRDGVGFAAELLNWSRDIILLTDGDHDLSPECRERLARHSIAVDERPLARLDWTDDTLHGVVFEDGERIDRGSLFYINGEHVGCELIELLGCDMTRGGTVQTGRYESTSVPGLYVAGDASHRVQFAIVAAAEGAMAAFAVNNELIAEDFG